MNEIKSLFNEINKDEESIRKIFSQNCKIIPRNIYFSACTCLDSFGDTTLAINEYFNCGVGTGEGEMYLRLFGLAQCIKMQQEIIVKFFEFAGMNYKADINFKNAQDFTLEILNIIQNLDNKAIMISRAEITDDEYKVVTNYPNPNEYHTTKYKNIITEFLKELKKELDILIPILREHITKSN